MLDLEVDGMKDNGILKASGLIDFKQSDDIVSDLKYIIETSQKRAYQAVNTALVCRNWLIGYRIYEEALKKEDRANYGSEVILNRIYITFISFIVCILKFSKQCLEN